MSDELAQYMENSSGMSKKYRKLTEGLCELIEDFALVSFLPLNIQDKERYTTHLHFLYYRSLATQLPMACPCTCAPHEWSVTDEPLPEQSTATTPNG